ncbi:MAG TPA: formate/nitrite transporter family protein [Anaerolineales bacterium]|nr:formate/nitrite transporter family protein [Anaerolineales bacterium]
MSEIRIDALLPVEMAARAEDLGVRKVEMPALRTFMLAVLAGAFIALGALFATTVSAGAMQITLPDGSSAFSASLPYGVVRLLAGLVFSLGLILVVVGGAELFTGNNLIVMAWASGKVRGLSLLRNWAIVYLGNFVGSFGTAILVFVGRQYTFGADAVGITALRTAISKCELGFVQAVALGVLCNALVCLAVWLTFSARSTIDRILATIFPIAAFVAAGFEHSVANMYFIPFGLLIKYLDPAFVERVAAQVPHMESLSWPSFLLRNLVPVTVGNVIGGAVLVAAVYWAIFLRRSEA